MHQAPTGYAFPASPYGLETGAVESSTSNSSPHQRVHHLMRTNAAVSECNKSPPRVVQQLHITIIISLPTVFPRHSLPCDRLLIS